ncbi:MAG TPA: magnesium transporter CorA family protein [Burkholderiaceae bacterium]|nr:magnesium transporter CorA family protein [Burkholderiaceae bacterium]
MRVFHVGADRFTELAAPPATLPDGGFLWIGVERDAFETGIATIQGHLHGWTGGALVDLHVSDLLNVQLPSHFDSTSWYDLLVFRRLTAGAATDKLVSLDTSAVGFAVFDRVLLTVHPTDCPVREHFVQRLQTLLAAVDARAGARLPATPADLMLRMVNHMVDGYLELRRALSRQLADLQRELLDPKTRFDDWSLLLASRNSLNLLEDTCEDQRAAIQEWIDTVDEWPSPADAAAQRERDILRVRSRDVLEHIERVLSHVRRLEQSAENAVQMHFSALSHRTNAIMRTLTVLTAIFLPLNLITGFFGMNFDALPLIHTRTGVWIAVGLMAAVGLGLALLFWRKRYLGTRTR